MNALLDEIFNTALEDTIQAADECLGYSTVFSYDTIFDNGIHIWLEGEIDGNGTTWGEGCITNIEVDASTELSDEDIEEFIEEFKREFEAAVTFS